MKAYDDQALYERTVGCRTAFTGRALTVDVVDIVLADGRRSVRDIVRHRGAVVVLAQRPDGCFVLVKQMRKAIEEAITSGVLKDAKSLAIWFLWQRQSTRPDSGGA